MTPAFLSFGFGELLLVGIVALLVFGGNLPDVMRTLGRNYARLRASLHEFTRPVRNEMRELTRLSPPTSPPFPNAEPEDAPPYPELHGDEPAPRAVDEAPVVTSPGPEIDEPPPV